MLEMHRHLISLPPSKTNLVQFAAYERRLDQWYDYFYKKYKNDETDIEEPKFLPFKEADYVLFTKDTGADYLAPDGSASSRHYTISSKTISYAGMHPEIEEVWYCLSGHCTLWRKGQEHEDEVPISPGVGFKIPRETSFQLRNTSSEPAGFFITTKPPRPDGAWQGVLDHHWDISSSGDSTYHREESHGDANQTLSKIRNMNREISDILGEDYEKLSKIFRLVSNALVLDGSNVTRARSLDNYYQQVTELYKMYMNGEEGIIQPESIYKEIPTQTPKHDLQDLLPKDSKKVDRFFDDLPWPRLVGKADTLLPALIIVTHLLMHHIPFLDAVQKRGLLKMVIPKTASSDLSTIQRFQYYGLHQRLGKSVLGPNDMNDENKTFPVVEFDTNDGREVTENPERIAEEILKVTVPGQSIIILDHGAYFKNVDKIQEKLPHNRIIGISEATLNGEIEYQKQQEKESLSKPVISISHRVKKSDDVMIGDSIVRSTERIIAPYNVNLKDQQILVIGYGPVGSAIAENLRKDNVMIYDISSDRQMGAIQHYKIVRNSADRDKALMRSEFIFCATGNKSLRAGDYPKLRDGCFIVLGTSADIEIDEVPEDQYTYRLEREGIHRYDSKKVEGRYFYILGPKIGKYIGAVNFSNLQPAVGNDIYNVLAMEVAGLCQIQNEMFTEQTPGVHKIGKFYEDTAADTWLWYYNKNQRDPEEILRERHEKKAIDDDTYKEISTALEQSRELQKKYSVNRRTLSLPRLEPLRQSYAEGKFETATFNEIHSKLETSIESEQEILKTGLGVRTFELEILRQSYAEGKFETATFNEIHSKLEASIKSEQEILKTGLGVRTFELEVLRQSYTQAQIEAATLDKIQQEAKLKFNTVAFDAMQERLVASIKSEQKIRSKELRVDPSALATLRRGYADAERKIKAAAFDERHQKLVASIESEQNFLSEGQSMDPSALALLRNSYAEEKIDTATFDEKHQNLEASIKSEQNFLREEPRVDLSALVSLRKHYGRGRINTARFKEIHQNLEASIESEQNFLREGPRVDTSALVSLRNLYGEGRINTACFKEIHQNLEASIESEQNFLREGPHVDLSALVSLRKHYGRGRIDTATFNQRRQRLEASIKSEQNFLREDRSMDLSALVSLREYYVKWSTINQKLVWVYSTENFDGILPGLEASINKEKKIRSEDPDMDISMLASLALLRQRHVEATGGLETAGEFATIHKKVEAAFKYDKDHRSNEKLSVVLDLQKAALGQLAEEEILIGPFVSIIDLLHFGLEKVLKESDQEMEATAGGEEGSSKRPREEAETEAPQKKPKMLRRQTWGEAS
ncbi:MAG TPA: hypothetical protein VGL94_00700 [Ktedonobacteraceae bacterium]